MLPPRTAEGVLSVGIHSVPLEAISAIFGSSNAVRRDMARRLRDILGMAQETGYLCSGR